jgi:hypothetical protein
MSNFRWTAWSAFRAEAVALIRKGTNLLRSRKFRLLQISEFPPFCNPQSWEILLTFDLAQTFTLSHDNYSVVRRTWRMDVDYPDIDDANYAGPDADDPGFELFVLGRLPDSPTIEEATIHVSSSVDTILQEVATLSVPAYCPIRELPEDSVSHEVSFGSWGSETRFRWIHPGPTEWNELIQATDRILASLRVLF